MTQESDEQGSRGWLDFSLDLRSLALGRISLSLLILYDLFERSRHLYEHYGDNGLIRRSLIRGWSLHPSDQFLSYFFVLHAMVMIAVAVGWKTRWTTTIGWLLLLSLHNRCPFVLYGADGVLMLMMLWGCFLPWGRVWSLDSRSQDPPESYTVSFKDGGFWLGQVTLIYIITALRKSGSQWTDGTAVYHALTSFQYFRPAGYHFGMLIAQKPLIGEILTFVTLGWEYLVGFVIYTRWRMFSVVTIVIFHFGVLCCLDVGMFPVSCTIQAISLIPTRFWDGATGKSTLASLRPFRLAWVVFTISMLFGFASLLPNSPVNKNVSPFKELECMGLRQTWNMFAPKPPTSHGWYSAKLTLASGEEVEFFTAEESPYSTVAPARPTSNESMRWGIFGFVTYVRQRSRLQPVLTDYLRRRWNELHPDRPLKKIEVIYYIADIVPYRRLPYKPKVLYSEDVRF